MRCGGAAFIDSGSRSADQRLICVANGMELTIFRPDTFNQRSGCFMLTGSSLLARVRELGACSKAELVRACGYVSTTRNLSERLNYTAFYEALLEAKGFHVGQRLPSRTAGHNRPGRYLTYTTKVHFNGNLMVGSAYTALLDLKPGDTFTIQIDAPRGERQRGQIRLLPCAVATRVAACADAGSAVALLPAPSAAIPSAAGPANGAAPSGAAAS